MQTLARNGYTKEQVIAALHAETRQIKFRYDLLDKNEVKKTELTTVVSGEVTMASLAQIKRTARFTIRDDGNINWLSDRIQPFCMLKMPDGGWVEWSLGIFLLSSPKRKEENEKVYREVEAYDGLQILYNDKFDSRYSVQSGTKYTTAIKSILESASITKINIEASDLTLSTDREWEIGTEKIKAINQLLAELNYTPLWVDENGFYTAYPYRSPSIRSAEYSYKDDSLSVIYNGIEESLDMFSIPNKWVVVASNPETDPLISSYTNNNPNSPTSTVNRNQIIVDFRKIDNIASQSKLDEYVERIAFEASQIYGKLAFETAIMPMHSYADILQIEYSPLAISGKYSETRWTIPLKVGARMRHEIRKVISI